MALVQVFTGQMTRDERLREYAAGLASPVSLVGAATSAGIGQWRDRPPEWKQGGRGFGLRFGSAFATHITQETLLFGVSSALHEDNRYVPSGAETAGKRVSYALKSTFLARHDDGSKHISISKIGSLVGASFISRTWQPASSGSVRSAGVSIGISAAVSAGLQVTREFRPGLWRR
jgi:hypothetical protein